MVGHGIIQHDSTARINSALSPESPVCFDIWASKGARTYRNYMYFLGSSRASIRGSVLERVLPIPGALVVEADEFMSLMSIAHSSAISLSACLTHYRLHDQNQHQFDADDSEWMCGKLNSLSCPALELTPRPLAAGNPEESIQIIVDQILVKLARMNLAFDGGMPWQTYFVEQEDFRLRYSGAPFGYREYKQLLLLLTLILPPRTFYKLRGLFTSHDMGRDPAAAVRETPLPNTEPGVRP